MIHLSEEQFVEVLYGDFEKPGDALLLNHLDTCDACQKRLAELRQVTRFLDSSNVEDEAAGKLSNIGFQSMVGEFSGSTPGVTDSPAKGTGWIHQVIAASILLMIAAGGFFAGAQYQRNQISHDVDESLAQLELRMTGNLQSALQDQMDRPVTIDSELFSRIDRVISNLVSEQKSLRNDLQSLAINAESEILLTNRELQAARAALIELQQFAEMSY